jgi:hypothetical protein
MDNIHVVYSKSINRFYFVIKVGKCERYKSLLERVHNVSYKECDNCENNFKNKNCGKHWTNNQYDSDQEAIIIRKALESDPSFSLLNLKHQCSHAFSQPYFRLIMKSILLETLERIE